MSAVPFKFCFIYPLVSHLGHVISLNNRVAIVCRGIFLQRYVLQRNFKVVVLIGSMLVPCCYYACATLCGFSTSEVVLMYRGVVLIYICMFKVSVGYTVFKPHYIPRPHIQDVPILIVLVSGVFYFSDVHGLGEYCLIFLIPGMYSGPFLTAVPSSEDGILVISHVDCGRISPCFQVY